MRLYLVELLLRKSRVMESRAGVHVLDHSILRQPLSFAGGAHNQTGSLNPTTLPSSDLWIVPIFLDLNDCIGPVSHGAKC